MNDNIFRLFLVLAYIITKLFTFQVLFAQFYVFSAVHDAHSLHDINRFGQPGQPAGQSAS